MMRTCVLALLTLAVTLPSPGVEAKRRMRHLKHIVLDPGHGGTNQGTPGAHGVFEKYVTLPLALEIERQLLEHTDAKVTLTRRTDEFVGLRERTRLANEQGGDIFLSIHCNASHSQESNGLEVYFLSADSATEEISAMVAREEGGAHGEEPSPGAPAGEKTPLTLDQVLKDATMYRAHEHAEVVAGELLDAMHATTGAPRRGVMQAPFAVLKEAMMPAVVVEAGYLSHEEEGKKLLDAAYRKRIARGIVRAILRLDRSLGR